MPRQHGSSKSMRMSKFMAHHTQLVGLDAQERAEQMVAQQMRLVGLDVQE